MTDTEMNEIQKVEYAIHHQAIGDCPRCGKMFLVDLGEFADGDGCEVDCDACGLTFELQN